ncbi:Ammonium transporter 1 [Zancudomyces culisetae]|uniref:Ammonium transporter 1 n=1 Tax=Zancudomyces culisetae TaxID=1213189 RepID=A0A1R1PTC6_ZANCU|nr:Ammonium transporter 1 [Zancudomyces culisetae]|eukprot:OMH84153.1 Ammonium transporter 1 [Zancudomyces culisetae]
MSTQSTPLTAIITGTTTIATMVMATVATTPIITPSTVTPTTPPIHQQSSVYTIQPGESGDIAWMMFSTALVFLMIPGVGYFYSGLVSHPRYSLSILMLSLLSLSVVSLQWCLIGFPLVFSTKPQNITPFVGFDPSLSLFVATPAHLLAKLNNNTVFYNLPVVVFAVYQGMFAAITPILSVGSVAGKLKLLPCIIYFFLWTTLVYDPIAYWNWSPSGWLFKMGALDFAGGLVVHANSGISGFTLAVVLSKFANKRARSTSANQSIEQNNRLSEMEKNIQSFNTTVINSDAKRGFVDENTNQTQTATMAASKITINQKGKYIGSKISDVSTNSSTVSGTGSTPSEKPNNIYHVILGTVLLWFGWFGFNAGSSGAANAITGYAFLNTNLAASAGGLTWTLLSCFNKQKAKPTRPTQKSVNYGNNNNTNSEDEVMDEIDLSGVNSSNDSTKSFKTNKTEQNAETSGKFETQFMSNTDGKHLVGNVHGKETGGSEPAQLRIRIRESNKLVDIHTSKLKNNYKLSAVDFCNGAVAGLVAITPAAGYVACWASIVIGILAATGCYYATRLKDMLGISDVCDVLAVHGIGGIIGAILTGVFARSQYSIPYVITDGASNNTSLSPFAPSAINGGWLDGNFIQVPIQLLACVVCIAWSVTVTFILAYLMSKFEILNLRSDFIDVTNGNTSEAVDTATCYNYSSNLGSDDFEMGENGYHYLDAVYEVENDGLSISTTHSR